MAVEQTLSIIKPDAVEKGLIGRIIARFEEEGLRIAAIRKLHLSRTQAEGFYAVHRERPFFDDVCTFMSRSPCVVMVLEGEDAIPRNRQIMGATNPADAAPGTLRALFGSNVGENAAHGSDSPENARIEIAYFFRSTELH